MRGRLRLMRYNAGTARREDCNGWLFGPRTSGEMYENRPSWSLNVRDGPANANVE